MPSPRRMNTKYKSSCKIERLSGDYYFSWKFRMTSYLKKKGYGKTVTGDKKGIGQLRERLRL
jgi:hypothetical protein